MIFDRGFPYRPRASAAAPVWMPPRLPAAPAFDEMPHELRDQLIELGAWAEANRKDGRRDSLAFSAMKIPAVIGSASARIWAHFGLTTAGVLVGAFAGVCVVVDGVHPRGMLRNIHCKAYHDISILATNMLSSWRGRKPGAGPEEVARKILRDGEAERRRIAAYVRDAETALTYQVEA